MPPRWHEAGEDRSAATCLNRRKTRRRETQGSVQPFYNLVDSVSVGSCTCGWNRIRCISSDEHDKNAMRRERPSIQTPVKRTSPWRSVLKRCRRRSLQKRSNGGIADLTERLVSRSPNSKRSDPYRPLSGLWIHVELGCRPRRTEHVGTQETFRTMPCA